MFKLGFCFALVGVFFVHGQGSSEENCECVPFYLCQNGTINTNGETIIDVRMGLSPNSCNYLEICCKKKDQLPISRTAVRSPPPPSTRGCGYRNSNGITYRITGHSDNEAEFGEFPWTVAIMTKSKNDVKPTFKCGGSLIHPQIVLTAAHCIYGSTSLMVRAGEWDTQTILERYPHQERKVISGVIHGRYNNLTVDNDIALLFLNRPFNLTEHINLVCLPPNGTIIASNDCFVTGWGKEQFESDEAYQSILKKIQLPIISREKCQRDFRRTRLGSSFTLHRSFMCAGGEQDQDACTGDGGGPLVCPISGEEDNDRYQQVGIVAWGIGCGTKGVPGAYVDVAYFRSWIDQQMSKKGFSSDS